MLPHEIVPVSIRNNVPSAGSRQLNCYRLTTSILLTGTMLFSGCGSIPLISNRAVAEVPVTARSQSPISKIMGPTERNLRNASAERDANLRGGTDADLDNARMKLKQAKQLYEDGQVAAAEKAFKQLVKERRERYENFGTKVRNFWGVGDYATKNLYDNFGDPVEEDALFLLAECQFEQRRFTRAQDSYDDLLNRYPSTRHMDRVTKQLFRVARYWLGFPNEIDQKQQSEIQLANAENEKINVSAGVEQSAWDIPLIPNLTDKTRPVYDADGRGLQALRSIWLHDATGPLADDALMLSANHNLRTRNFVESKRLYELLREQYPDSPHLRDAFLLGSHVTLASYEGPEYDGSPLEAARDLKQTMLQIFPDMTDKERQMLQQEINQLHNAEINRLWGQVEYYQSKNIPESIALHCNVIINRYPNSEYAQRARGALQELQAKSERSGRPMWAWGSGQKPAPASTPPAKTRIPDPRLQADADASPKADSESSTEEEKPKRNIFGFLRRAEEPPQLQTPPPKSEQPGRVSL